MSGNDWQTPDWYFDRLRQVDEIQLDPCTVASNPAGATSFVTPTCNPDGFGVDWLARSNGGLVHVNPPYGRGLIARWVGKINEEAARGCEIVALLRGDTSTQWAREVFGAAALVCFPPRIKFTGATGSPNFTSMIAYFGDRPEAFARAFADLGPLVAPVHSFTRPTRPRRDDGQLNTAVEGT